MFSQLYTINRMQETPPHTVHRDHDDTKLESEKHDVAHLERISSGTPPSEREKMQPLTPATSKMPVVHDKVLPTKSFKLSLWLTITQMNPRLFMILLCMTFLWIGSQIPLYLFGSVLPTIYQDIGGVDRYTWFVIGYLIPNAALCPFVGALSDLFGRQKVAIVGQICLIIGPIITATAHTMNIAIGKSQHIYDLGEANSW